MAKRSASTLSRQPLSFSYSIALLLFRHAGIALAESSSNSTTTVIYADETDSGSVLHPLVVCVGLFLLGLILATMALESRRAIMARGKYRDYRDRVEESMEQHHFSKRDPTVLLPLLGGGPTKFHFRGRYVDCSFYQNRVLPETNRACCHRSRLRRNVGDQEVPMEGVFTIVDEEQAAGKSESVESSDEESNVQSSEREDQYDVNSDERYLSIEGHGSSTYGPFEIVSGRLCPYSGRWYMLIEDRPSVLNCCIRRKLMMSGFLYTPSDDHDEGLNGEGKCPGSLHFSGNWRATNGASGQAALLSAWPEGRQPPPGLDRTENKTESHSWSCVYEG